MEQKPGDLINWRFVRAYILSCCQAPEDSKREVVESMEEFRKLSLHYLGEDVEFKNYSIAEMAAQCYMTPVTFKRKFLQIYGEPPHRWLLKQRLGHASRLLKYTSLSIKEICYRCDFSTPSNFSRAFKCAYKCTPEEYRARDFGEGTVTCLSVSFTPNPNPDISTLMGTFEGVAPFDIIDFQTYPLGQKHIKQGKTILLSAKRRYEK